MPSLRGTVSFDHGFDGPAVMRQLVHALNESRARFVTVHQNRIAFGGGVFRLVSNWNVLNSFYTGDIVVDAQARRIHYRVSITQLIVIGTALTAFMGCFMLLYNSGSMWWTLPIMWLWIVGMNLVFGLVQLRDFVRKSVKAAADPMAIARSEREDRKARETR